VRQWSGLLKALGIADAVAAVEQEVGVSFAKDDGLRFIHRERLFPLVERAVAERAYDELAVAFEANDVCWGPYQTLHQALTSDPNFSTANPIFGEADHASGHRYLTPGAAASFMGSERGAPPRAPTLGQHTDEVLASVLGLSGAEIGNLHDKGLVAGPA
jgi:2-methylfumaryl-CoA isomerase